MPNIQVTFNDLSKSKRLPGLSDQHSTVSFEVQYRGKRYDCVGHMREATEGKSQTSPRATFTGYYGYNGPINIQELRSAALDYFQTVSDEADKSSSRTAVRHDGSYASNATKMSYVISVGGPINQVWQLAS